MIHFIALMPGKVRLNSKSSCASVAILTLAVALIALPGCKKRSPSNPSGTGGILSGTFTGTASDVSGPGRLTWQLTQAGTKVNGTLTFQDERTGATGEGTVSGTLAGSTLTFMMEIRQGRIVAPFGRCAVSATGTAQVTDATINGTFTGQNTCTAGFSDGTLTLTKG